VAKRIPVFVNAFNHLGFLRKAVEDLSSHAGLEVIVVDNASTYPPLLAWYENCPCEVIRLSRNLGPRAPWICGLVEERATDYYVVTDFDLDFSELPPDFISELISTFERFPHIVKAGLALRIDDLHEDFPLREQTIIWERRFWEVEESPLVYRAPVDTTFALYSKARPHADRFYEAVRMAGGLTVRHRPWYWHPAGLDAEDLYYIATTRVAAGWKKIIWHSIDWDIEQARATVGSLLPLRTLEALFYERKAITDVEGLIKETEPSRVLFSSALDGALVFRAARQIRNSGLGTGVTYAGLGEEFQAVRRLLLGFRIDVRPGLITDAPLRESFDLVVFTGLPSAIQFAEAKHVGIGSGSERKVYFTGLSTPNNSLHYFLEKSGIRYAGI
jgi:hypothetical protein